MTGPLTCGCCCCAAPLIPLAAIIPEQLVELQDPVVLGAPQLVVQLPLRRRPLHCGSEIAAIFATAYSDYRSLRLWVKSTVSMILLVRKEVIISDTHCGAACMSQSRTGTLSTLLRFSGPLFFRSDLRSVHHFFLVSRCQGTRPRDTTDILTTGVHATSHSPERLTLFKTHTNDTLCVLVSINSTKAKIHFLRTKDFSR